MDKFLKKERKANKTSIHIVLKFSFELATSFPGRIVFTFPHPVKRKVVRLRSTIISICASIFYSK